jgi:hypothetical protein
MQADAAEVKATFLKNILVMLLKGIIAALRAMGSSSKRPRYFLLSSRLFFAFVI